ncbi:MAG TPA: hypothetical protein VFP98_08135, partial [Candidatus Polarisedimenticolia bacterium]|nr:hypothetical protein [Candidatus Polarisedimenticolia bacterium]
LGLLLAMMMICRPLLARAGLSLPGSVALSPLALALARLPEEPTAILTAAAAAFILAELAGRLRASA